MVPFYAHALIFLCVLASCNSFFHFGEETWDMLIMVLQASMETVEYISAFPSLNINSLHPI